MRPFLILLVLLLAACAKPRPLDPPAPATAAQNRAIGIALTEVPAGFSVAPSGGNVLRLTRSDGGEVTIRRAVGGEEKRVPGGSVEILCQLGRGRLIQRTGEIQVFTRPVVLSYRYPATAAGGDGRERMEQALAVLGEIILRR